MREPQHAHTTRFSTQRTLLILTLLSSVGLFFFLHASLRGPDYESYYSYARSLLYDGDILLINEFEVMQKATFISPTGYASVLANIGAAVFWLPFLALALWTHGAASLLLGVTLRTDGFDAYDVLWLNFGHWLYGLATLALSYHFSRRYFARRATLSALVFTAVATPFFYYMSEFVPNTSLPTAFVAIVFLLVWERARRERRWAWWLLLGSLGGIALSIASYNGGFLIFPLITFTAALREPTAWRTWLANAIAFGAGTLIGYLPQMLAWYIHFGVISNPYGRQLDPLQPRIVEVLFSTYHGAFFYTPFLLIAALGCVPLWRRDRTLALGLLGAFAVHIYATGMLLGWWAGASLGIRYFVGLTPLFVLSAAALWESAGRWRALLWLGALASFAWTYLIFLSIHANGVSALEYYPLDQQLANQWSALVELPRLLAAHWQPLKSPLVLAMLLPFAVVTYALLAGGRALLNVRRWDTRMLFALALAPLLLSLLLVRAAQVGELYLAAARTRADYASLPRGVGDPLDLSSTYHERARYHFRNGDVQAADADFREAQRIVNNNSYALLFASDARYIAHPMHWQIMPGLALAGYSLSSSEPRAGEPLWVVLYWSVDSQPLTPYFVRFALVQSDGNVLVASDEIPTQGQLAFRAWPRGALVRDQFRIMVPASIAPDAELTVRIRLIEKDSKQRLPLLEAGREVDGVLTTIRVHGAP